MRPRLRVSRKVEPFGQCADVTELLQNSESLRIGWMSAFKQVQPGQALMPLLNDYLDRMDGY